MIISNANASINAEPKKISEMIKNTGSNTQVENESRTLMDYITLSEKDALNFDDCTYSDFVRQIMGLSKGKMITIGNLQQYAENVNFDFLYDVNKINDSEEILSENNGKCLKINMDKVNYLINFYTKNGGDMSVYPFDEKEEWIERSYKFAVSLDGYNPITESKIKSTIESSGLNNVSFSIDAKGSILIEADDGAKADVLSDLLNSIKNDLKSYLLRNGEYCKNMSSSNKSDFSDNWSSRIALYDRYGVVVESLKIEADGSISGLPEESAKLCEENYLYAGNLKNAIKSSVSSDEIIGTFTYKNGSLYIV